MSATAAETPPFLKNIDTLIRARYPLLYLVTYEEQRVEQLLEGLARAHGKETWAWSWTTGLRRTSGKATTAQDATTTLEMLEVVGRMSAPALVMLKDFHRLLDDPGVVRALRELAFRLKSSFTTVVLISPVLKLPEELEKEATVVDVPLPTRKDLMAMLKDIARVVTQSRRATVELDRTEADALVAAAHGLTLAEAENAFAKAIAHNGRLDAQDTRMVLEEKKQVVRKSGLLEYQLAEEDLSGVGGLGNLKGWLERRKRAFSREAKEYGLPVPKGLLLLGVQGCGKSLTARAIAASWGMPLLRLDMGRIFSSLIGSSEENLRRAIGVAETLAPVVLWMDEIEKGLSGASHSMGDSGVAARVFGTLLTWLQEKTAPVFVVATANRIDLLPPELLRKGRFDEIFFVDLPTEAERREIFEVQLRRRKRDPAAFNVAALAAATPLFSGAEVAEVLVAGMYDAFAQSQEVSDGHLLNAARQTRPLATTLHEEVNRLREWARNRTVPAAGEPGQ